MPATSRGACEALHEAITVGNDKGDLPVLASALDYSVQALATLGEPETTATICGALDDWLRSLATNPAYESPTASRHWLRLVESLGDAGYEAAITRGRAMPLDRLVPYALAELERIADAAIDPRPALS